MAEKIDGIEVHIGANTSDFNKGMASAKTALASFNKDTQKISAGMVAFGSAVGTIFGNVITKAFGSLNREMDGAIARFDSINNFPKVMANLGIGAKDSQAAISTLSDKLLGLPTTLDAGARAVQRFTSANGNVKASTQMFLALNNAILAGGADMSVQSTALEQLSQAYAKGKPDMMEWRSAMTAMPAQLKQVANAMGYVDASALGEALRSGKVSMNDFMATLIKLNKTGINGLPNLATQAKNATGGIATSMVNMKTAIQRGLSDIMNAIGQSNIASFFNGVAKAIGTAANYIAAFVKVAVSAAQALASLFGGGAKTSVASNIETATSAANNLKTSVGGVAGGLNDATGAAKKLKNQLASFDEMNVLTEPDSGGSGGGGGGGSIGDLGKLDFDFDTSKFGKVESEIDKIAKRIKKALEGMFDFDKIGKAIKRFADDVKKFLEPVGRIIGDLWNDYLKPLISWTGNELLPAFLNALGGALQFIGGVLNSVWNIIKPFIDGFLVPIAQFTGGVIVGVLNGIGDALRGMAQNAGVCDLVAAGLVAIGIAVAGIKISALVSSFAAAIPVFQGFLAASGSINVALMNTAASTTGLTSAAAGAGAGITGFMGTIAAAAPVIIAITGILVSLQVAYEAIKLQLMLNAQAHKDYMTSQQLAEQTEKRRTDGIKYQEQALKDLKTATDELNSSNSGLASAEASRRNAVKNLDTVAKGLNMTTKEATDYYEKNIGRVKELDDGHIKLMEAVGQVKDAEQRVTQAEEKRAASIAKVKSETDTLKESENMEIRAMMAKQEQMWAEKENWYQLANSLRMYASKSQEFTLENGKTVKRTKEEMQWLVQGVADDMGKAYKEWDKVWSAMPKSLKAESGKIETLLQNLQNTTFNSGKAAGENFGSGTAKGITNKQSAVNNAAKSLAQGANNTFNSTLKIHSPSKVMMKSGAWFDEGIAIGIGGNANMVEKAATSVAQAANTSFSDMLNPITDSYTSTLADAGLKIRNSIGDTIEANANPHITVKVGEDTLIDKVIDGINQASFLQNRGVINI